MGIVKVLMRASKIDSALAKKYSKEECKKYVNEINDIVDLLLATGMDKVTALNEAYNFVEKKYL